MLTENKFSKYLIYAIGENERYQPDMKRARAALTEMVKRPLPGSDDFSLVAEVALARIDRREGRGDSTDALGEPLRDAHEEHPVLCGSGRDTAGASRRMDGSGKEGAEGGRGGDLDHRRPLAEDSLPTGG